ncbi:hypothetical protein ATCC90586_006450 [Pythium insidiosum]|nr:hypothetical protein ATCC90586_006450 [Pythium insidiosum]
MPPPSSMREDPRGPAMAVLTDRRLLLRIVACADGTPGLLRGMRSAECSPVVSAVRAGSIRALEMLHAWHRGAAEDARLGALQDASVRVAMAEAVACGQVEAAAWLLRRFATRAMGPALWRAAFSQSPCSVAMLELLRAHFPDARVGWLDVRDAVARQWLARHGARFSFSRDVVRAAIDKGNEGLVSVLLAQNRVPDHSAALAKAVERSQWGIFFLLADSGQAIPSVHALDAALAARAATRNLVVVQTVCDRLSLPCAPVKAIRAAIERGALEMVEFFFAKYRAAFSAQEMDRAASAGQIEVLEFLWRQGIRSAAAIEGAAANGHLAVVRFLDERGASADTDAALDNALQNHRREVAAYLLPKASRPCRRERCIELLRLGFEDEWRHAVRGSANDDDDDGDDGAHLADAMRWAGSEGHLAVIRFITTDLARPDVGAHALEGAATLGSAAWMAVVYETTKQPPTLSVFQSAVKTAGAFASWLPEKDERLQVLQLLCAWCDDATREEALQHASKLGDHAIVEAMEAGTRPSRAESRRVASDAEDWMLAQPASAVVRRREAYNRKVLGQPPGNADQWGIGLDTRPKRAIAQGDLDGLKRLHTLVREHQWLGDDPDLSFEDVTVVAIASGCIPILAWVLSAVCPSQPEEENLLEYAVYYGQKDVAEWLLDTYPTSCRLPLAGDRFRVSSDSDCSQAILEWLDTVVAQDSYLKQFLTWSGIVDDLIVRGDATLLSYVNERHPDRHPDVFDSIEDPLLVAAHCGHVSVVRMLLGLPAARDLDAAAVQDAASAAAREDHFDALQCLVERNRDVDFSYAALEAAQLCTAHR